MSEPVLATKKPAEFEYIEEANKPVGGLKDHEETTLTAEERAAEKKFLLKADCIILPLLSLMYFLASLDRGDIGNAAVAGMTTDLGLTPQQYSNCVSLFYLGYIVFELPGTIFLRKISPPIQLGLAMMAWGTFTTLISIAQSWGVISSLRVLVGCAEAFLQAGPLYLTFWYKREQLASRGALFFSVIALAGTMNGVIAYGIQINLNGARGWPAWRWIFLIEGIISVFCGFIVIGLLPPVPEKLRWGFTQQEKAIATRRTKEAFNVPNAKLNWTQLKAVMKDPKIYFYIVLYSCMNVSLASFGGFLPVIIKSFGYSALQAQLNTIPVYVVVAASIVSVGFISDRLQKRGIFLILCYSIAGLGWLLLLVSKSQRLSFAACFFVGLGTYPQVVLIQTWMNNNILGFTKRAGSLAAIMMFGQCMALAGTQVYSDPPYYYRGNGFALGAMVIGTITTVLLMIFLARKNAAKKAAQDSDEAAARRGLGLEEIWDDHPDFYYYL